MVAVLSKRGAEKVYSGRPLRRCTLSQYPWKTAPFKHQREGVVRAIRQKGKCLLYCEPGTGKTKMAIDFACFAHLNDRLDRMLVVCPKSVMGQWERQIRYHLPDSVEHTVYRLEGSVARKIKLLQDMERDAMLRTLAGKPPTLQIAIINYESTWREGLHHVRIGKTGKKKPGPLLLAEFDLVVADECHRIGNATTKQSRALHDIGGTAKFRLGMSGTPIRNKPLEFYSQAKFIDEMIFTARKEALDGTEVEVPMSWTQFKRTYADIGTPYNAYVIKSYRNLDDLFEKVDTVAFKRRKEECLDLPEQVFETVPVSLDPRASEAYVQMATRMVAEIERRAKVIAKLRSGAPVLGKDGKPLTEAQKAWRARVVARASIAKLMRLRQIASGIAAVEEEDEEGRDVRDVEIIGSEVVDATLDIAEDLVAVGEKVVIFCVYQETVKRLVAACRERGWRTGAVWGQVVGKRRDEAIRAFQEVPVAQDGLQVIVCQIASGSEGIDLYAASHMIFAEVDYSYTNYRQACDRIHRQGQTRSCTYYHIVVEDTIVEDLYDAIAAKEELADQYMAKPADIAGRLRATIEKLRARARKGVA